MSRSRTINMRVTEEEYRLFERAAHTDDLGPGSISELLRAGGKVYARAIIKASEEYTKRADVPSDKGE